MKEYRICMPLTVEEVSEVYLDVLHPALSAQIVFFPITNPLQTAQPVKTQVSTFLIDLLYFKKRKKGNR